MYVLELKPPEPQASAARSHNKPTNLETWHCRFGHTSETGVWELLSKGMVEGLNITSLETQGCCKDCIFGKHARWPFDEVVTPETEVLERAHLDLWGKACVQSMGGKSYMMLIEDGGSSHMEGYFLDSKATETTLATFLHYHVMAECQMGQKLKCVWTDMGPEWVNELWVAYFEKHGIIHEMPPAYSLAVNVTIDSSWAKIFNVWSQNNFKVFVKAMVNVSGGIMSEGVGPPSWDVLAHYNTTSFLFRNLCKGTFIAIIHTAFFSHAPIGVMQGWGNEEESRVSEIKGEDR